MWQNKGSWVRGAWVLGWPKAYELGVRGPSGPQSPCLQDKSIVLRFSHFRQNRWNNSEDLTLPSCLAKTITTLLQWEPQRTLSMCHYFCPLSYWHSSGPCLLMQCSLATRPVLPPSPSKLNPPSPLPPGCLCQQPHNRTSPCLYTRTCEFPLVTRYQLLTVPSYKWAPRKGGLLLLPLLPPVLSTESGTNQEFESVRQFI